MVTPGALSEQRIEWISLERKPTAIYVPLSLEAEGQVCGSQSQKARGCCNLGPRHLIFHQTVSKLPVAKHLFLGSWKIDIWQEFHSLRSGPQRRRTAHLRLCPHGYTQETDQPGPERCIRCIAHLGQCVHQAPSSLSYSDLGNAQNEQPIWVCAPEKHPRT